MITAVDVIRTKRDGGELSTAQIDWVIDAYTKGAVADEQMSALAMAIFLNGARPREIADWVGDFVNTHYQPEPKKKVKRNDPLGLDRRRT